MIHQQDNIDFFLDSNTILHLRPLTTTTTNTLEVNTINSNGNKNLVFQRFGSPYMTLTLIELI